MRVQGYSFITRQAERPSAQEPSGAKPSAFWKIFLLSRASRESSLYVLPRKLTTAKASAIKWTVMGILGHVRIVLGLIY